MLPIRIQEFHILNEHPVAKLVEKIIWPFLSSKIRNRVYKLSDYQALHFLI